MRVCRVSIAMLIEINQIGTVPLRDAYVAFSEIYKYFGLFHQLVLHSWSTAVKTGWMTKKKLEIHQAFQARVGSLVSSFLYQLLPSLIFVCSIVLLQTLFL